MPNNSKATAKGKLLKNSTCFVYAPGPLVAKALEKKCSMRKRPMGMIPVSECNRRRRNECPFPARNGAAPPLTVGISLLGEDATRSLNSSDKMVEPFIILAANEPSQGRLGLIGRLERSDREKLLRKSDDRVLVRWNWTKRVRQYRPIGMIETRTEFGRSCARVTMHR